jgi:hypothetical protein
MLHTFQDEAIRVLRLSSWHQSSSVEGVLGFWFGLVGLVWFFGLVWVGLGWVG